MKFDSMPVLEMLKKGVALVGEFRGSTVDVVPYVDKKTGQRTHFNQCLYRVELESSALPVLLSLSFEDGKESTLPQFKKGDVVAASLSEYESVRGVIRGRVVSIIKVG